MVAAESLYVSSTHGKPIPNRSEDLQIKIVFVKKFKSRNADCGRKLTKGRF